MTTQVGTGSRTGRSSRPSPETPWQQAGFPAVRVEATTDGIYPYLLHVGDHETVDVPMTAPSLRSLRDALTALLTTARAPELDDFVTEWALVHGAVIHADGRPAEGPSPAGS
jgi:hypothetical protein